MRFLSLGAGVQSSTLALMIAHGEIDPVDAAIFADTQWEPRKVYDWLDWLEAEIQRCPHPFPVHRVTKGSLRDAAINSKNATGGSLCTAHAFRLTKWTYPLLPTTGRWICLTTNARECAAYENHA